MSYTKQKSLWIGITFALLGAVAVASLVYVRRGVTNVMHPALNTLSGIPLAQRWSHPEMLRIRTLGQKAALQQLKLDPNPKIALAAEEALKAISQY